MYGHTRKDSTMRISQYLIIQPTSSYNIFTKVIICIIKSLHPHNQQVIINKRYIQHHNHHQQVSPQGSNNVSQSIIRIKDK